ncbi:hypothetical protein [Variovorax sp. RA8]|uniref:hypothetical protein n=1 Tax=Variovorax sp. (strain JCM 16519 / RA8) TaxID=662548 RepID=UPI0013189F2A|nr:hypothetical protein [Variovorax sp. RA8]VTU14836.1 hypothetical protein RA8CHR_00776 [Variovorax sp. RA8]
MHASTRFLPILALMAFVAFGAQAQEKTDGSDYHPLMMNSPDNADVQAGAIAAAHPAGTESIGQSTSAPAMVSKVSDTEIYAGAVAASHGSGTELPGQSTAPMPPAGSTH